MHAMHGKWGGGWVREYLGHPESGQGRDLDGFIRFWIAPWTRLFLTLYLKKGLDEGVRDRNSSCLSFVQVT